MKNKTLTKTQVEKLVEYLADKTLSFGCRINWEAGYSKGNNKKLLCRLNGGFKKWIVWHKAPPHDLSGNWNPTIEIKESQITKILGHPIRIGDVLEKIYNENDKSKLLLAKNSLFYLWYECGFTKSLQELIEESGWETIIHRTEVPARVCGYRDSEIEKLKSPQLNNLLTFLWEVFELNK